MRAPTIWARLLALAYLVGGIGFWEVVTSEDGWGALWGILLLAIAAVSILSVPSGPDR